MGKFTFFSFYFYKATWSCSPSPSPLSPSPSPSLSLLDSILLATKTAGVTSRVIADGIASNTSQQWISCIPFCVNHAEQMFVLHYSSRGILFLHHLVPSFSQSPMEKRTTQLEGSDQLQAIALDEVWRTPKAWQIQQNTKHSFKNEPVLNSIAKSKQQL